MSSASRMKSFRERQKDKQLVDIRTEVPIQMRERLKDIAKSNSRTLKDEVFLALDSHVRQYLE